jgi:hypothetical protein
MIVADVKDTVLDYLRSSAVRDQWIDCSTRLLSKLGVR